MSSGSHSSKKARDLHSDTWSAVDGLGRALPGHEECGSPRPGRFVGIFYFLWMQKEPGQGLYDISRLLAANPEDPAYGPVNAFHWWGEPHFGYYLSDDEWVIRKHASMLSDAGIDVMIFDVTNALTYDRTYLTICATFQKMREAGEATPQIAFITHSGAAGVVKHLYDSFYSKRLYPELWFEWQGKPLILSSMDGLDAQLREFFTFRESWAWTAGQQWFGSGEDKWPWLDNYPQNPGWHESPHKPEQISVCVAQHPVSNIGRSFHDGHEPPPEQITPERGLCFAEQWKRALAVDPEFVFVTGWNEWIAQRFLSGGGMQFLGKPLPKGGTFFVDEYDQEYSRDIEPMSGGHRDDYYYQLIQNTRRFKGVRASPKASPAKTIRMGRSFRSWESVTPEYLDTVGDTAHRDHAGWGSEGPYRNSSGRNDLQLMKVARDRRNLYFYARTHSALTPPSGEHWMMLMLNANRDPRTGWEGYDFLINRKIQNGVRGSIERHAGPGWNWHRIGEVTLHVLGSELQFAIPRPLLKLSGSHLDFEFKWVDNVSGAPGIQAFMDQGDVAPNGRFAYRFRE